MGRLIVLDSGPLGLATNRHGKAGVDRCLDWIAALEATGAKIVVPEIADYEVRRELLRAGATDGIARLDDFVLSRAYLPITTAAMHLAADFWADARKRGRPTADPKALDADCILAAQAKLAAGAGDDVIVATTNVGHLGRFLDAQEWTTIA